MKVEVLTGPQGGGKSTVMRNEAIAQPGLYLFALPTIELLEEQSADFFRAMPALPTVRVHKDSGNGPVAKRLTEARKHLEIQQISHGVIFTTHETLMSHELEGFDGWHARIDEAPASVQAGQFNIGVSSRPWLKESYEMVSVAGSEWSAIKQKIKKPGWKAVDRDQGAKRFGEFIKQAAQPDRVFVRTTSWDERNDIDWFSMWTPLSLCHFASVQIAGSSYTDSVGYRAARAIFDHKLSFSERSIAPARSQQPTISIQYFTRGHEGATTFWGSSEGRLRIKQVCDNLAQHLPHSAFWSGNEVVQHLMEHRLPGSLIKPMAMGINKHRQAQDCAFIFSGKARPNDGPLKAVFGLTDDDIRHAREDDAIAQFVMRGAIRDLDYGDDYAVYLYSQSQATRLRDHLLKIGFTEIEVIGLDSAGLMEEIRITGKRTGLSSDKREVRAEQRKAKAKERSQRNRDKKKAAKSAMMSPV